MSTPTQQSSTKNGTPVWISGDGPPVVLIHGVLMDHRMWHSLATALSSMYRVYCIDMLGHGAAPDPTGARTLEDFVAQVDDVVNEFCGDAKPVVGGFSMGGLVSQAYATRHAEKLAGLIIMNAVYDRTPAQSAVVRSRYGAMKAGGSASAVESAQSRWFTDADRSDRPELVEETLNWMREGEFGPKLKAHRVFATSDTKVAGRLGGVACPALIMTGDGDAGSTPDMSRAMACAFSDAELHILDGQRHMMPVLDSDRVNPIVARFLARAFEPS